MKNFPYDRLNNQELVRAVDNKQDATELERILANRIDELCEDIRLMEDKIGDPYDAA